MSIFTHLVVTRSAVPCPNDHGYTCTMTQRESHTPGPAGQLITRSTVTHSVVPCPNTHRYAQSMTQSSKITAPPADESVINGHLALALDMINTAKTLINRYDPGMAGDLRDPERAIAALLDWTEAHAGWSVTDPHLGACPGCQMQMLNCEC